MKIATIEIDLAKNVFQVHGVDERGHVVLRKQIRRDQLLAFMVNLPPCVVGIEACGSVHDWARKFQDYGHTVRLMSPQFVKPYVKSNTNDVRMPRQSAKPSLGRTCDLCRFKVLSSKRYSQCTGFDRASSWREQHRRTSTVWALLAHGREFRANYRFTCLMLFGLYLCRSCLPSSVCQKRTALPTVR